MTACPDSALASTRRKIGSEKKCEKAPSRHECQNRTSLRDLGWRETTLGAILTAIEAGKSFQCEERPPNPSETGVVKVSAVTWGTYNEEESKTCTDATRVDEGYFILPGDFLFSRANTIQLVGACVI